MHVAHSPLTWIRIQHRWLDRTNVFISLKLDFQTNGQVLGVGEYERDKSDAKVYQGAGKLEL